MLCKGTKERTPWALKCALTIGACHPPNIIALEQNDNQTDHKLHLRNIENPSYWPGIPFGK